MFRNGRGEDGGIFIHLIYRELFIDEIKLTFRGTKMGCMRVLVWMSRCDVVCCECGHFTKMLLSVYDRKSKEAKKGG